jgi:hypothetical protein
MVRKVNKSRFINQQRGQIVSSHHHHYAAESAHRAGGDSGAGDGGHENKVAESLSNVAQGLFKGLLGGKPLDFSDMAKTLEEGFAKTADLYKPKS